MSKANIFENSKKSDKAKSVGSKKSIAEEIINSGPIPGFNNKSSKSSVKSASLKNAPIRKSLNNINDPREKNTNDTDEDLVKAPTLTNYETGMNINDKNSTLEKNSASPRSPALSNTLPHSTKNDSNTNSPKSKTSNKSSHNKSNSQFSPEKDTNLEANSFQDNDLSYKDTSLNIKSDEVHAAVDLLLEGANPMNGFDIETLKLCIKELNRLKLEQHAVKKYLQAEYISRVQKNAQKAIDNADFHNMCANQMVDLLAKVEDAQNIVDTLNREWDDEFRKFEDIIDSKTRELQEQHTIELDNFDSNIPTELPSKYLRHSPQYFQLRHREESLARNGEYIEANKFKLQADKLEEIENTKQFMKLQDDLQNSRNALVDRHNKQFSLFAQWVNEKRHMMLLARQKALEGPERRLRHYTNLVADREQNGVTPNPNLGFSTNRVSKKDSLRAIRQAGKAHYQMSERSSGSRKRDVPPLAMRPQTSIINTTNKKPDVSKSYSKQRSSQVIRNK